MFETMYDAPGIGLAAIQVGVPERILVIDLQRPADGSDDEDEPEGSEPSPTRPRPARLHQPGNRLGIEELTVYNEGCLSVPEMYGDVDRPARIRAKWLDENGTPHEQELDGLMATCLQHEMDHLERRPVHRPPLQAEARHAAEEAGENAAPEGGVKLG